MKNNIFKSNLSITIFEFIIIILLLINTFKLFDLFSEISLEKETSFMMRKDLHTLIDTINELEDCIETYVITKDDTYKQQYFEKLKVYTQKEEKVKKIYRDFTDFEKELYNRYKKSVDKLLGIYMKVENIMSIDAEESKKTMLSFIHKNSNKIDFIKTMNQLLGELESRKQADIDKNEADIKTVSIILVLLMGIFIIGNIVIFFILLKENRLKVLTNILLHHETQKKELYKTVFSKSKDGILIVEDGVFVKCNHSAIEMLGYHSKHDLINKTQCFLTPKYQPNGQLSCDNARENTKITLEKGHHSFEQLHTKSNGEPIWIDVVMTDISTEDKSRFLVVWRELDSKKELEKNLTLLKDKAINANKAKSDFLANMSHEIRTPLNAIMGFIELLQENEQDTKKLKYLDIINSSSNNLIEIINDILDFSKIESGNLDIEHIDFNPAKEFSLTRKLFQAKFQEKGIKFFPSRFEMPSSLNGDILRIKQVINNLLSNAIKFTPSGKNIFLDIEYKNERLYVKIKDEGIGISEKYQKNIFKAFTQEDSSTTRKYGGTGLGLTISYKLVKAMGGEIKIKSKIGFGSTFYFDIPIPLGKEIEKPIIKKENSNFNGKKVLLVEDNKANQMFMKIVLKKLELEFDIANDGVEAIQAYKSKKYDLILMDENMPNMNGIEATKEILAIEKDDKLTHTPIVALTANALKGDREKFLNAGMDEYLTKPLNREKLGVVLNEFFTQNN